MMELATDIRSAREAHLQAIEAKQRELEETETAHRDAKKTAGHLATRLNRIRGELRKIISHGPDPQQLLTLHDSAEGHDAAGGIDPVGDSLSRPQGEATSADAGDNAAAIAAPDATAAALQSTSIIATATDPWRDRGIVELGLTADTMALMLAAGVATLGALNDLWSGGKSVAGLNGLTVAHAKEVGAAWREYVRTHPEVDE